MSMPICLLFLIITSEIKEYCLLSLLIISNQFMAYFVHQSTTKFSFFVSKPILVVNDNLITLLTSHSLLQMVDADVQFYTA